MTGELYSLFLRERCISAVKNVVGNDLDHAIWQDDQDKKHRMENPMNVIKEFFVERIEPEDGDAKLADVYPIESIWGILKEKVRGKQFKNEKSLIQCINKEWRLITPSKCETMIDNIPKRLWKVIKNKWNQIYEH